MPNDNKEPQSYGSQADWLTGQTGQTVNEQPAQRVGGTDHHAPQPADSDPPADDCLIEPDEQPPVKVTGLAGGAKRDSYFKHRDYE
jgi:hypothetical protein